MTGQHDLHDMDDLLKSALVGTAGQPPSVPDGHPADAVAAELASDPERSLLLRAGARAVWRLAGHVPRRDIAPVEPCPPDVAGRAAGLLRAVMAGEAKELLPEFLERLAAAGRRLPPELLPDALPPVGKPAELRRLIRPVLGERGRWLARLNPDWSWAAGGDLGTADRETLRRVWEEGATGERVEALAKLREIDPGEGRSRLAEAFGNEKADVRARLLEPLAVGLSIDDEPLLEDSLSDRSETVRGTAADLLARLPDSKLVARMTERADALLSAERGGLLKRKLKLVCAPPTEIDKDWLRDGVPKDAPAGSGKGKRAVWVEAAIGCVPVSHWTDRFDVPPETLIASAAADDFGDAVLRGWTRSATRPTADGDATPDSGIAAWLTALAGHWAQRITAASGKKGNDRDATEAAGFLRILLPRLAPPDADRLMTPLLEQSVHGDIHRTGAPVFVILQELPRPWPVGLSRTYLRAARAALAQQEARGYWWANTLPSAAAALAPESLNEALAAFADLATGDEPSSYRHALNRFLELVRLRSEFLHEVPPEPT